jgi:uncharacterized membrane protein
MRAMDLDARVAALLAVADQNSAWMIWNTLLAWVPAVLALGLFTLARDARRGPVWWGGAVLFVLFLPNAPYVVTDLVHLQTDVGRAGGGPVVTTVLPVYAVLIASGFLAYYASLAQLRRYLTHHGLGRYRTPVTLGLHAVVAVGIFLGRWSRLNSWEPVVHPRDALERTLLALTWADAPLLIAVMFVVTAAGHFVTRAVVETAWAGRSTLRPRLSRGPRWTAGRAPGPGHV